MFSLSKFILLIVFIVVVEGIGYLLGTRFPSDAWYEALNKPLYNPPGYIFGIVWPILYVLIAVAGWRVFTSAGKVPGWGLWVTQMILNFAFPPLFFGYHQIFWSMILIAATLLVSAAFTSTVWNRDRLAGVCFIPYMAWLAYALLLNASLWLMN